MCSGSKFGKDSVCADKLPKVNWLHHKESFHDFSCKDRFLSSNFLFSLPPQKPRPEEMLCTRSLTCNIRRNERLQASELEKAWKALSSTRLSSRNYIRPGVTAPVQVRIADLLPAQVIDPWNGTRSAAGLQQSGGTTHGNLYTRKDLSDLPYGSDTGASICFNYAKDSLVKGSDCSRKVDLAPKVMKQNIQAMQGGCGSFSVGLETQHYMATDGDKCHDENFVDAIDDDILENIDVDQIVMEHYQANGTPEGSTSKSTVFTPLIPTSNATCTKEEIIPSELREKCHHGFKVGLCPEATSHLQEMKDRLIAISNDLLDNFELSSSQIESLRQERLHLNKQILQLENYIRTSNQEERNVSHSMASTTAAKVSQPGTPITTFGRDPLRSTSEAHIRNEVGNGVSWSTPSSFFSTDRSKTPLPPLERESFTPKLLDVNYTEGCGDPKWKSADFPWTRKLEANNRKVFGNHSFRPNQREVINATMSGYDVFVLMPTGGGKSLTYQLPALICPGVTLVVSPLVSLIQDQIMHLKQANIPAAYLSANMEWAEQQEIFRELMSTVCRYKMLYVTPEKVAKSDILLRHLDSLYSRESLARIVIDEAHCVSQWGHDFRPDYQSLGILKQKFPTTPVLALTATATATVKEDVVQALGLENCILFSQSFNRPNLWYSIMPKTKKCIEDIDKFIKENHYDECGIIYCLSRMDCEKVAEKLQECGHKVAFYHGSMDPPQRAYVQNQWSKDEINIICATVAFGMGINKPDVRFVIHHSLPKSIEGYHQECGRAGRDGLRSSCVLYYTYGDFIRVKHMLTQGVIEQTPIASGSKRGAFGTNDRVLETNIENLLRMVSYCENDVDCRRFLQLIHFGENFSPINCQKTCDNCLKMLNWIEKDVTDIAKQLVELVKSTGQKHSSTHILEVFRGSLSQNIKKYRHDTLNLHGAGKHLAKGEASRIMRHLVVEDILVEDVKKSDVYGSVSSVLKVNESKAYKLCSGQQIVVLRFPTKANPSKVTPAKGSLLPYTTDLQQNEVHAQAQNEGDLDLSVNLYSSLRKLRTVLVKEAGEGFMAYHIFTNAVLQQISKRIPRTKEELLEINGIGKVKVSKYGDRILDTIESTIKECQKASKSGSSGSSNENADLTKRRRESKGINSNAHDDDFAEGTYQSKKRVAKIGSTNVEPYTSMPPAYARCIDVDLDGCDEEVEEPTSKAKQSGSCRVLPQWLEPGTRRRGGSIDNLFTEYMFKK